MDKISDESGDTNRVILTFLNQYDIAKMCLVCKKWHELFADALKILHKLIFVRIFPEVDGGVMYINPQIMIYKDTGIYKKPHIGQQCIVDFDNYIDRMSAEAEANRFINTRHYLPVDQKLSNVYILKVSDPVVRFQSRKWVYLDDAGANNYKYWLELADINRIFEPSIPLLINSWDFTQLRAELPTRNANNMPVMDTYVYESLLPAVGFNVKFQFVIDKKYNSFPKLFRRKYHGSVFVWQYDDLQDKFSKTATMKRTSMACNTCAFITGLGCVVLIIYLVMLIIVMMKVKTE